MDFRTRALWLLGIVVAISAVLVLSYLGKDAPIRDAGAEKLGALIAPPTATQTQTSTSTTPSLVPPKCDELEARIQKFMGGLPRELGAVTGEAADQLAFDTERTIIACGQYLAECEAHPKAAEIYYRTAKLLHLLSARKLVEWQTLHKGDANAGELIRQKRQAYMADIARLAKTAFERLGAEHPLRPRALQIHGQAAAEGDRHDEARAAYEKFLEIFGQDEESDAITIALCRELLELERYDDGIKLARAALEKFYKSDKFPHVNEMLWKLVHSKGDFNGMLEHTRRVETVFPHKLSGGTLKDQEREAYERYLDFNGFRKGYTLFARGDFEGAKAAFQEHIAQIETKREKLQGAGKDIKPEVSIYMDRSRTCLKVLEEIVGLPGPVELELGNTWVTQKTLRLAEAQGKTVGVVFRGVRDERSAVFAGPLSQWVARQPNMELVTVCFRKGGSTISELQDELREELGRIGYEGAAGFDPDETNKTIFRRYLANVGSATFLVLNRRGEVVWYQQDPRGVDVDFAKAILTDWAGK